MTPPLWQKEELMKKFLIRRTKEPYEEELKSLLTKVKEESEKKLS